MYYMQACVAKKRRHYTYIIFIYNYVTELFQLIQNFLNESYTERFGVPPEHWMLNLLWSASVSVYLIGGCGGAFSVGWFANRFGR